MTDRPAFLQTTAAVVGSLILPKSVFATSTPTFHFIHADSCMSWPVADPVLWSLEHAHEPIVARATEGLSKPTECDGDRIIRLVVRRGSPNLLDVQRNKVSVQLRGQKALTDVRPFFKAHGLARAEIEVALKGGKKQTVTIVSDR